MNESASIVIHCAVEQVYKFMSEPKNRLRYDSKLIDVRQTPEGPLRLGTQIVEVRSLMGKQGEMVTEVSELEPNERIGYRTRSSDPMNAVGGYQFHAVSEGTQLTFNFAMNPKGMMQLVIPFVARGMKQDVDVALANIKAILEQQSVGSA